VFLLPSVTQSVGHGMGVGGKVQSGACPADVRGIGLSWHCCAASPLAAGVEHPGCSVGIVQEVIFVDLILDRASILHMEG
jgi:hypothetical protein